MILGIGAYIKTNLQGLYFIPMHKICIVNKTTNKRRLQNAILEFYILSVIHLHVCFGPTLRNTNYSKSGSYSC